MYLRTMCIVACLYLGFRHASGANPLLTSFSAIEDDYNCEHFQKTEMTESSWNKNAAKPEIQSGNTANQPVHIAQIHLDLGKYSDQHVVRLCTVDCRNTPYDITGITIKSVGPHPGSGLLFTNNNKQVTFSAQADQKGQGLQFDVNVWGKPGQGSASFKPNAGCISPRHIAPFLDNYCRPGNNGRSCSGRQCGGKK